MHRLTAMVDLDGHRHVFELELADRFQAQLGKGNHLRLLDRLRHQVDRFVLADHLDRGRAAFGLADHA